jgi:hypothetical protein
VQAPEQYRDACVGGWVGGWGCWCGWCCVCTYVYKYTHKCVCIYTHSHTNTYTHTHNIYIYILQGQLVSVGHIYLVSEGDVIEWVVRKFGSSKEQLLAFNRCHCVGVCVCVHVCICIYIYMILPQVGGAHVWQQ